MGKIIAISNHKGGVGKTTSTLNIGAALQRMGKKVLLIDLDPQANLTQSLGLMDHTPTIYEALRGEAQLDPIEVLPGLDVVTSTLDLSGAEVELSSEPGKDYILKELLEPLRSRYNYILIDSPPSLGLLTMNALAAAQEVYIPLQAHYLALQGMSKLQEIVEKVRKRLNKGLRIGGVFVTQYDQRKVLNRNVAETIREHFPAETFRTAIRDNVALAEAPTQGVDVFRYAPKSTGAADYQALAKEIEKRNK
jgi:chromosome partitioning protein